MRSRKSLCNSLIWAWGCVLITNIPLPGMSTWELALSAAGAVLALTLMVLYTREAFRSPTRKGERWTVGCFRCNWKLATDDEGSAMRALTAHAHDHDRMGDQS